jgi:hypothetical protein
MLGFVKMLWFLEKFWFGVIIRDWSFAGRGATVYVCYIGT